ncbi:Ribosome biogenesis protein erb1 [Scedosporium apiospermum]|uniref:Ribosome biogenesis protein ERB1 n=1 Tax=Pseudallescheria apiosperma TaxID=563466 RepID=A0A084GAG1_PSEDA|nr:Ribosome biogenesis protein erb1 [Scedosporium apiospermum]KEZ44323.1 Ribosome biogenesis protein erb1 [Scedosporium apiospermum]
MPATDNRRKRKISLTAEAPADDGFGDGVFEGVLSQSDDDDSDFVDSGSGNSEAEYEEGDLSDVSADESEDAEETEGNELAKVNGDDGDEPNYRITTDANGDVRYEYAELDPVYDSDDTDAGEQANTIGNIPLSFYDSYPHIGYTLDGKKIMRPAAGDALDSLLDSIEVPKDWTGLTDPATGLPLRISQDELEILKKIQLNEIPEDGYDPYPDLVEYFTSIEEKMPLSAAPEPKRRFVPSKHEAKRVAKMVRLIREGKLLPYKPPEETEREEEEKEEAWYDVWANEEAKEPHVMHIPAPKLAPPEHDLSINPPEEYLPSKEERKAWEDEEPEDRTKEYLPTKYDSLRKVPAYMDFTKERFERCLDLYLAPRVRKNRLNIDPMSLLPKLPRPEELKPFPTLCQTTFRLHEGRVRSISVSPTGDWVASGGDDGTVCVWDLNGHLEYRVKLSSDEPVDVVRWRPTKDTLIIAAAAGDDVFMIVPDIGVDSVLDNSRDVLDAGFGYATNGKQAGAGTTADGQRTEPPAKWARPGSRLEAQGVLLKATLRSMVKVLSWHRRGDFFCTVSPNGQRNAIAIHTLSKHLTQIPFRRLRGLPQTAHFHPSKPLFFVATRQAIRCYDLQQQQLVKILQPGARHISSFDIHPGGDNVLVGSYDRRLLWHDMDLSARPYKTMRFHPRAIRAVKFHKGGFPLFADASDDGTLQIFHGKVVSDLMENATIVPVKMLKGHEVVASLGVLDVDWHTSHPWCGKGKGKKYVWEV